jgi:hypothetical protein
VTKGYGLSTRTTGAYFMDRAARSRPRLLAAIDRGRSCHQEVSARALWLPARAEAPLPTPLGSSTAALSVIPPPVEARVIRVVGRCPYRGEADIAARRDDVMCQERPSRMCILLLRTATFSSSGASKFSQKAQSVLVGASVIERLFQTFRALPETPSFFIRHFRLQHLNDPAAAKHTR